MKSLSQMSTRAGWLIALVFFFSTLILYTRNNEFPFYYHPDESGKTRQIVKHKRNMRHPLLLLTTTEMVMKITRIERVNQNVVIVGRWVSATFAATTVAALVMTAFYLYGAVAAVVAGIVVGLNPDLFEYAHYMKEDPALVVGLALLLLSLQYLYMKRSLSAIGWVGAATAVALSGKYVGVVALPIALPIVLLVRVDDSRATICQRLKYFLIPFFIALAVINYRWFSDLPRLWKGLTRETGIATTGHRGMPMNVPHTYYLNMLRGDIPWPIHLCAGIFAVWLLATWRKRSPSEWLALGIPLVYLVIFSFSPKVSGRYFLPVTVFISFAGALGIGALCAWVFGERQILRSALAAIFTALIVWTAFPDISGLYRGYLYDDRKLLIEWVRNNLPASAVIAQDDRVNLPNPAKDEHQGEHFLPQTIRAEEFVPDLGSLDELRAQGVDYVAVCDGTFRRFFNQNLKPLPRVADVYNKRREFYERLFKEGRLVWSSQPARVLYLRPGLHVYDIKAIGQ